MDPATKKFSAAEAESGFQLEAQLGRRLSRENTGAADFVDKAGKTYDLVGPVPQQRFDLQSFTSSIGAHLNKQGVNHIVIDIRNLTAAQRAGVQKYVSGLSKEQAQKIIYLN